MYEPSLQPNRGPRTSPDSQLAPELLLQQIYPTLLRRARWLTSSQADAEDLVHDTVIRLLMNQQLHELGPKLSDWMSVVMRNLFIDGRRRRRARNHVSLDVVPVSAPDEAPLERWRRVHSEELSRAVQALDESTRRLLEMRWEQLASYRQISEALGIPTRTVGTRLLRARKRIRRAVMNE